jgi:hypothetical protein
MQDASLGKFVIEHALQTAIGVDGQTKNVTVSSFTATAPNWFFALRAHVRYTWILPSREHVFPRIRISDQ